MSVNPRLLVRIAKMSKKAKKWDKTKKQRQEWWAGLTFEQKGKWIEKWQAQKEERRKHLPPRELRYNPKYPWVTEGVNSTNRGKWWAMIKKKNPWLKVA